ncbi:MAG: PAS domain S-box protein [Bacteroidetes bacterium]|nr:PAS domain S-box protein [Bacteroidota bacterium]
MFPFLENTFDTCDFEPINDNTGSTAGVLVSFAAKKTSYAIENRLKESEARFRAFVTASSDVIYRISPDWKELRQLDGRGFLTDTGAPDRQWLQKYIHPKDQPRVLRAIKKAIDEKTIYELEHQVLQADGTIGWTFSRAVPILNSDGEIIEWFGAASDITKRKNIEEALSITRDEMDAQRRLYEGITGSTPDLVYALDLNYKFLYANRALLEMWGRSWDQSIGQGLLALGYEPWHAEMHEREIDQVSTTKKSIRGEVSFPHATLGKRIYDYIFAPVFNENGEVVLIAGTTRDISDLKLAEEALKQSEEQFRTLTESLPQLIWTSRPDGYTDFFNPQWYEYTGSTPEASQGNGWSAYVHPDHLNGLNNAWRHSLQTGFPIAFEFQLKKSDGSYQWFYVIGNPIRGQDGEIRKWVGALTNIEGQKAVEGQLERLVAERTKELKRSNEDLLQFAHVASHDLKEPVRKIKTFINRLIHEASDGLSDQGKVFVNKIESAANRMYQMIDGVLRYSTLTNVQEDFVNVDLDQVLRQIESDLEVTIHDRNATIRHAGLPIIEGAPVLVYQLFYNLINNSLKFVKKGIPAQLTITGKIETQNGKTFALIDVADNGIGFPQDYAENIFNTFTRLNAKDQYEGTGLGLALCKKIVERHGGSITATSKMNEGAVFHISLPVKQ